MSAVCLLNFELILIDSLGMALLFDLIQLVQWFKFRKMFEELNKIASLNCLN